MKKTDTEILEELVRELNESERVQWKYDMWLVRNRRWLHGIRSWSFLTTVIASIVSAVLVMTGLAGPQGAPTLVAIIFIAIAVLGFVGSMAGLFMLGWGGLHNAEIRMARTYKKAQQNMSQDQPAA